MNWSTDKLINWKTNQPMNSISGKVITNGQMKDGQNKSI